MAKVFTNETNLHNIGDAIREKNDSETTYKPSEMAAAILALPTYPEPTGTKAISSNGVHDVKDYASANVNVPNSYAAGDEGKVVDNGALVSQGSLTITENDTYDTTLISELIANISGGGGGGSTNILSGTDAPTSAQGSDGSIYLRYGLPSEYDALDYIQGTGTQYFNVYHKPNIKTRAELKVNMQSTGESAVLGSDWTVAGFFLMTYQNKFRWHAGNNVIVESTAINTNTDYEIEVSLTGLKVNNDSYSCNGTDPAGYLFGVFRPNHSSQGANGSFKLYYLKIYNGDSLCHWLIPAKRKSDDTVGVYDVIGQEFIGNAGTGSFQYGEVISNENTYDVYLKVSGAWQPLIGSDIDDVDTGGDTPSDDWRQLTDYIQSSGTQYIDTGYNVKSNSAFEIIANASTSNSQYPTLFGVRRSNMTGTMTMFAKYNNDTRTYYNWGGSNTADTVLYSHFNFNENKTKYQISKNQVIAQADNGKIASIPVNGTDAVNDLSVYVFSLNEGGSDIGSIYHCTGKLYRFRIYEDDALVHEFVPWTDTNDVVCLKDTVTGDLKYNAGTGVFTRGTDA